MKRADTFFNTIRLPIDLSMILLAGAATYLLRTNILAAFRPVQFSLELPFAGFMSLVLVAALVFAALYAVSGLYAMKFRMGKAEEFLKILIASSAGILLIIIYIFLRQELFNSRFLVLGGWLLAVAFVCAGRLIIRGVQKILVAHYDFGVHRVLIVGNSTLGAQMAMGINRQPSSGYRIAGLIPDPDLNRIKEAVATGVDEIILSNTNLPPDKVVALVQYCHEHHIIFKFVPNLHETLTTHFDVDVVSGVPVIELKRTPLDGWGQVLKRVVDVALASLGLAVLSPVFLAIALAVKLDSPGPVLARLKRISRDKEFILYKFRGMVHNAEELKPALAAYNERPDGPLFKMKNDPRVTRVGWFIRRYRLDELAQLWNVLKGDISLVGPRPHEPAEVSLYQPQHKKVLAIKAGATGLAQISGSSDLSFDQEVAYDSFYIENWSLLLDLKIIFKTFLKIFSDQSAV